MLKNLFLPVSLLAGTIIGAGMFSLPFVFTQSGLPAGFLLLALGAVVYTFSHLMYAEIILNTPGEHRFVGYAREYLGRWASLPAFWGTVVEMILVLTIYLVISVSFSNLLLGVENTFASLLLFWFLGSVGIFISMRRLAALEFLITGGIVAIIFMIFGLGLANFSNVMAWDFAVNFSNILMPLAPIIFALSGRVAIPSLVKYFNGQKPKIRQAIIWGTALPAVVYGFFVLGIITLSPAVSGDAISGLIGQVSPPILMIIGVLGLLSIYSSYIVVGLDIKNILQYDLNFSAFWRGAVVVGAPLALHMIGLNVFQELVSFTGGIFLSLEGLFIILMWLRVKKKIFSPAAYFTAAVFLTALGYEIFKIIK